MIGGGFGGLQVVKHLRHAPVSVTLVDCRNYHLFQPLTYQVATGALSPGDVTYPLRSLFGSDANVRVALAEVTGFDLEARKVLLESDRRHETPKALDYDTLVVAAGSSYSYFGHDEWREVAGEVKSLESALSVRSRILGAFERAELAAERADRDAETTFVIVGGGPTGVEIAGQIGELARDMLNRYFKHIDASEARILLVETADRILTAFPESLSAKATKSLEEIGVTVSVRRTVVDIDPDGVTLQGPDGEQRTGAGADGDLGGRRARLGPRFKARRARPRRRRPSRASYGRARPDAARAPGGDRARRHGQRPRHQTAACSRFPVSRRSRSSRARTRRA